MTILPNQCVSIIHVFKISEDITSISQWHAPELGSTMFRITLPADQDVFNILSTLDELGHIVTDETAPFNCIDEESKDAFCDRAQWTAFASTSFFDVSRDKQRLSSNSRAQDNLFIHNLDQSVDHTPKSVDLGNVRPVIQNYFLWQISAHSHNNDVDAICSSVEPIIYALCEASICHTADSNLHYILDCFVGKSVQVPITTKQMRRYIANIRVSLHETEKYHGSSRKDYRRVYAIAREHVDLDLRRENLETSISSTDSLVQGVQSEHNEWLQKKPKHDCLGTYISYSYLGCGRRYNAS